MSTRLKNDQGEAALSHITTNYQSFSETKQRQQSTVTATQTDESNHSDDPLAHDHQLVTLRESDGNTNSFRGFSTSIADMFTDPQHERVDCCAVTCCGILQHDRDRYLLTGVTPPSILKRVVMHLFFPLTIFVGAGMAAMQIQDALINELVSTSMILVLVAYLLLQCAKGRTKRLELRKDLLYTKYQIQQQHLLSAPAASREQYQTLAVLLEHERPYETENCNDERDYYLGQTRRDMRCAHPCCWIGCYAEDRPLLHHQNNNNNDPLTPPTRHHDDTVCTCLYETACPGMCGMHAQLCGMCALAQEARDVETCILPAPYRRIDYVTMEPVLKFYEDIYHHRHGYTHHQTHNGSSDNDDADAEGAHDTHQQRSSGRTFLGHPLSRLSFRLLQTLLLFWIIMSAWSYGGQYYWTNVMGQRGNKHHFQVTDFILLLLTFGQAFLLLAIWKYFVNRPKASELSLDAMIKFFASGFFLSASLALFWEMMAAVVINTLVSLLLAITGVDRMDNPESDLAWVIPFTQKSSYLTSISGSPTLLARFYWNTNDVEAVSRPDYATVFGVDHPVLYTFYIFVATFFVAGFVEELCKYFGFRMVEHPDFFSQEELEEAAVIVQSNHDEEDDDDEDEEASNAGRSRSAGIHFSKQCQSVQARGAAITLAMVSVAIGFACSENLMYIFFYAGSSLELELGVLIERSFFPVHPILAAIQSIGVCHRELEGSRATKLGRIIFPAVVLHGSFDFFIVFIAFIGKLVGQGVEDGDLRISNTAEFLSVVSCILVMFASLLYFYVEAGKQRERLAAIDRQATVDRSSLI